MDKTSAIRLIRDTFQNSFNKDKFHGFVNNLLNHIEPTPLTVYRGNLIPDAYKPYIQTLDRLGKYEDPEEKKIDILIVHLKKDTSLERARTMQRNFIAWYLNGSRGGVLKDAALVAFVSPEQDDWRFSFIKMEYRLVETPEGKIRAKEEFTPAKRHSFLVGRNEDSHTAKVSLIPLLINDDQDPLLAELEDAFSIEKVTKEFFGKYRDLFLDAKKALDEVVEKDEKIKADFIRNDVSIVDFCKKLLGQIVFLYFLQKKGWFGVKRGKEWGTGSKHFLRELFRKKHAEYRNFFNDILEPLFYNTLAVERPKDYSDRFDCKIPFLNGGLFDPINNYDWIETEIYLPDELFSNDIQTKEGDTGTGILDVFDRYNFTVKEDEPLEKEVAVDPEMLGKVFENFLEVKDRKSKGTYYTPREIVHYMCQESLINYLVSELSECHSRNSLNGNPEPLKEDVEQLIKYGETAIEHDVRSIEKKLENPDYRGRYENIIMPESIKTHAALIDEKLATIRVCDPAIGSGAFPLGMMHEIVKARQTLTTYILTLGKSLRLDSEGGKGGADEKRTPYNFKRHAIHNCLYGVDIDPGAVEIAKLRLWLSLMVDEEDIKHIKPLPNLDYKIMQGNSLLEEFEGVKLFDEKLIFPKSFDKEQIKNIKEKQKEIEKKFVALHDAGKLTKAQREKLESEQKKLNALLTKITTPSKDSGQEKIVYEVHAVEIFERLKKLHEEFFEAYHNKQKKRLRDQIDALEWELIETTLKEHKNEDALDKLDQFKRSNTKPFFLWKLNFSEVFQEKGGFDVVIANPPYIGQKGNKEKFQLIKATDFGKRFHQRRMDYFYFFFHAAIDLSKPKGVITYITTNYYITATYSDKLRKHIYSDCSILKLINFNELKIFESALGQHNMITLLIKDKEKDFIAQTAISTLNKLADKKTLCDILNYTDPQTNYYAQKQNELFEKETLYIRIEPAKDDPSKNIFDILNKITSQGYPLQEYCYIEQGIVSGADKISKSILKKYSRLNASDGEGVFILTNDELEVLNLQNEELKYIKKTYKNSDIRKWFFSPPNTLNVIYIKSTGKYFNVGPNLKKYLDRFKILLINRNVRKGSINEDDYEQFLKGQKNISYIMNASSMKTGNYYCISYARRGKKTFEVPKIVNSRRSKLNIFAIENQGYHEQSDIVITTLKPEASKQITLFYILALLNSRLYFHWFYNRGKRKGDTLELFQKPLSEVPIKIISPTAQKPFVDMVDRIIAITKETDYFQSITKQAKVKTYESQVNALVYELYGLTPEEIEIVEGRR